MEMVYYKCSTCGFAYQVPSYWSDHSPEKEMQMEHVNLQTKEMCSDRILQLVEKHEAIN